MKFFFVDNIPFILLPFWQLSFPINQLPITPALTNQPTSGRVYSRLPFKKAKLSSNNSASCAYEVRPFSQREPHFFFVLLPCAPTKRGVLSGYYVTLLLHHNNTSTVVVVRSSLIFFSLRFIQTTLL